MTPALPEYFQVNTALQPLQTDTDAAEFHGQLCGLLAVDDRLSVPDWLAKTLPGVDPASLPAATRTLFEDMLENSRAALRDAEFGFRLLVPDDEAELAVRVEALGHWCQGFLLGVHAAGVQDTKALPGELPEILDDFLGISQAESYELVDAEEDEAAYTELLEYVRISAQLFGEAWRENQAASSPRLPPGTQLH
ncbi:MAG TPA: UPF0149 family protein [Chromatiales bacterium]|nr:UPF0149 family protein [Chromatiales bacterium]